MKLIVGLLMAAALVGCAGPVSTPPSPSEMPYQVLDAIRSDAAHLAGIPPEQVQIIRAQSVTWNDASLGCPEPGMFYTQTLVEGFWVIAQAGAQQYDFRVDNTGEFRLCPAGRGQPPFTKVTPSIEVPPPIR